MHLEGREGNTVTLRIAGYQFNDADDPRKRFSWHMVEGSMHCSKGAWSFAWAALQCDESAHVSSWLRKTADAADDDLRPMPQALVFTEPNLTFHALGRADEAVTIDIGADCEFRPPWDRRRGAGDPFVVRLTLGTDQLRRAAADWDADLVEFPDQLSE